MDNLSAETLIYIQKLKQYFEKNPKEKVELFTDIDDDTLYKYLSEIAEKNYKESGDPILTVIQLQLLRKTLVVLSITKSGILPKVPLWMDLGKYGKICSN